MLEEGTAPKMFGDRPTTIHLQKHARSVILKCSDVNMTACASGSISTRNHFSVLGESLAIERLSDDLCVGSRENDVELEASCP
jgi:hypothetical protein